MTAARMIIFLAAICADVTSRSAVVHAAAEVVDTDRDDVRERLQRFKSEGFEEQPTVDIVTDTLDVEPPVLHDDVLQQHAERLVEEANDDASQASAADGTVQSRPSPGDDAATSPVLEPQVESGAEVDITLPTTGEPGSSPPSTHDAIDPTVGEVPGTAVVVEADAPSAADHEPQVGPAMDTVDSMSEVQSPVEEETLAADGPVGPGAEQLVVAPGEVAEAAPEPAAQPPAAMASWGVGLSQFIVELRANAGALAFLSVIGCTWAAVLWGLAALPGRLVEGLMSWHNRLSPLQAVLLELGAGGLLVAVLWRAVKP